MQSISASLIAKPGPQAPNSGMTERMMPAKAALSSRRMSRSCGWAIAIAEGLNLHNDAILKTQAPHQLLGTKIVYPAFHRHFRQIVRDVIGATVQPIHRLAPDGAPFDIGWFAAFGQHLDARIALADNARTATKGMRGRRNQCRREQGNGKPKFVT